jgi:hypothetical protein
MAQKLLELERVRYWQGQLLASGDLNTQLGVEQELRRLHNRSLHDAYGIAIGLEIELDELTGKIKLDDADNVTLGCGLAYDCAGRELIVQSTRALPLPSQLPMTLVISRAETSVDGIALSWKATRDINTAREVAITRLILRPSGIDIDPTFRAVVSRPIARPRIATGQTIPGETTWQPWKIGDTEVGVKVEIDTSAAGFTLQPHYFAEVVPGSPTPDFIPAWFASVADPTPTGFTLQLMLRRITRETLKIVDPKGQITQRPELSGLLTLDNGNLFSPGDLVARLSPLAEKVSFVRTLNGSNATLDQPLIDFADTKLVALGNTRRETVVKALSSSATFFEVTVANPELFVADSVVVKTNGSLETTRPSRIVAIDDDGTLELLPALTGLVKNDTLATVRAASIVTEVTSPTEIKVADDSVYSVQDVVARLSDPIEQSAPVRIVAKKADKVLVLSAAITGLKKDDLLGVAHDGSEVAEVNDNSNEVTIEVDSIVPFRKHDLVAKNNSNGSFSGPVVIRNVFSNGQKIRLSAAIPSLAVNDTIVAADFGVRATVINLVSPTTLTVLNTGLFPPGSYIAKIDELFRGSVPVQVSSAAGQTLTITAPITGLQPGDVIGLCSFPTSVIVDEVRDDGGIEVRPTGLLQPGDLITTPPPAGTQTAISLITSVTGNVIKLSQAFAGLKANDRLSVISIRGAVKARHDNNDNHRMILDQPARVRVGDFLADIISWRQVQASTNVRSVNLNQLQLSNILDGVLLNDIVGFASLTDALQFFSIPIMLLRLEQSLELLVGDEVLLIAFDRLTGLAHTISAVVGLITIATKTIVLALKDPGKFTFRPEDIFASVLFVRGSSIALIQKHDLFVSWLAVGEPDAMPRSCDGPANADCGCSQA